jgi:hypothetical protein
MEQSVRYQLMHVETEWQVGWRSCAVWGTFDRIFLCVSERVCVCV